MLPSQLSLLQTKKHRSDAPTSNSTFIQTSVEFPAPQHLGKLLTAFLGNQEFLNQRLDKLKNYFEKLTKCPQLYNSLGFLRMTEDAEKVSQETDPEDLPPQAPKISGKKLLPRTDSRTTGLIVC